MTNHSPQGQALARARIITEISPKYHRLLIDV
jgi:hypothetical protein